MKMMVNRVMVMAVVYTGRNSDGFEMLGLGGGRVKYARS